MSVGISLVGFALAAALGLTIALMYIKDAKLSSPLAAVHGLFAAIGVVVLIVAATQGRTGTIGNVALIVFLLAAVGGLILLTNHLKRGALPKPLIAVHGAAAVVAFLLLLLDALG